MITNSAKSSVLAVLPPPSSPPTRHSLDVDPLPLSIDPIDSLQRCVLHKSSLRPPHSTNDLTKLTRFAGLLRHPSPDGFRMTLANSLWELHHRLAQSWGPAEEHPPPRQRKVATFREQHIETLSSGNPVPPSSSFSLAGLPKLPLELILEIILLAAADLAPNSRDLLELARVSRAAHHAVFSHFLFPTVTLHGYHQIRSFYRLFYKPYQYSRLGLATLVKTRVRSLTFLADTSRRSAYRPALFDASQAQTAFEKNLLPCIRHILVHCENAKVVRVEGVPRRLDKLLPRGLQEFECLMGHYGSDLEPWFWAPSRWTELAHLQLHGPHFRLNAFNAASLAALPRLRRLALVVPKIIDSEEVANPLQVLLDGSAHLERLILVGHAEKDYVGNADGYRRYLRTLRQPEGRTVKVTLVVAIRKYTGESEAEGRGRRLHPSEVSQWVFDRSVSGKQWFDDDQTDGAENERLEHWGESWDPPEASAPASANRTGTNTPLPPRRGPIHQPEQEEEVAEMETAIEPADMAVSSDDEDDEGLYDT